MTLGLGLVAPLARFARAQARSDAESFASGTVVTRRRSVLPSQSPPSSPLPVSPDDASPPATGPNPGIADEELVRVLQGGRGAVGREEAFRTLVERYQERAFWISKGMVGNADDARDVAQEAFVRVFKSVDRFDLKLKFYTWFYQIVVNLSIDHLRRSRRRPKLSIEEMAENGDAQFAGKSEAPGGAIERDEMSKRIARVLDELPEKYRAVIVLRDLEGFDGKEVAGIEGATHATVRWRLHKARQMFREAWERFYGAQP